jgi:hypothetical protein
VAVAVDRLILYLALHREMVALAMAVMELGVMVQLIIVILTLKLLM